MQQLSRSHDQMLVGFETDSELILGSVWQSKIIEMIFRLLGDLVLVRTNKTNVTSLKRCIAPYAAPTLGPSATPSECSQSNAI